MFSPSQWLIDVIPHALTHASLLLIAGLIILGLGGKYIVPATTQLGRALSIAPVVIAVIVVAGGTSAPELIVSMQAALAGSPAIALGNVIGSNMANILLVMGLGALLASIDLDQRSAINSSLIMLGFTIITIASLLLFDAIPFAIAVLLLASSCAYIIYLLYDGEIAPDDAPDKAPNAPAAIEGTGLAKAVMMVAASIAGLLLGADFIVSGGMILANQAGFSEAAIGLSVIAVGTSLPEIVAVIASLLQKRSDVAIGNILGSNIFNLGIILGLTGLIAPLPKGPDITLITLLSFGLATIILTGLMLSKITLKRPIAFVFVGFYFSFLAIQF